MGHRAGLDGCGKSRPQTGFETRTEKGELLSKVHLVTCRERTQGEKRFSSTLSSTSAIDEVEGQSHAPAVLYPRERPGTHCIGGWVGPRAGLDE